MSGLSTERDETIRRAIRRDRRLRRAAAFSKYLAWLLVIGSISAGVLAAYQAWLNNHTWRLSATDSFLLVERGRPLPLLQFEPVTPALPLLHQSELSLIEPFPPSVFKVETLMNQRLSSLYHQIGSSLDPSNLGETSRAVTILEAAHSLNPEAGTDELIAALRALSDGFASKAGGHNLPEAWRFLKRARLLSEAGAPATGTDDAIRKRADHLSKQIERHYFHRIREHLLDGNFRAAEALVADLETCGFEHPQLGGFRDKLHRLGENRP